MVLLDGEAPFSKPGSKRRHETAALEGVLPDCRPLFFCGGTGFVERIGMDCELPNVVEERRPSQPVAVGEGQT